MGFIGKNLFSSNAIYISILLSYSVLSISLVKRLQRQQYLAEQANYSNQLNLMRFYDLFLNIEEGIFSCDEKGIIVDANPAFANLLQISQPQKQDIATWFQHSEDKALLFDQLNKHGLVKNYEVQCIIRSGPRKR